MLYKYIVITDGNNSEDIQKRVRDYCDGYFITSSNCFIVTFPKKQNIEILRDTLKGESDTHILVIGIFTTGETCAKGFMFTKDKTWDWISKFSTNDVKEIKENTIKEYKTNVSKNIVNNAGINPDYKSNTGI